MLDQPAGDFDLVEIDANVQQRRARQRSAVQCQGMVGVASQLRRIDFLMREGSTEQSRVTTQMRFD